MSYKRESHHVLAGSLSYWPPGDLLSEGDALALTNFRCDQAGALCSRLGHANLYTGLTGSIRSLIKALGARYAGSNVLYLNGSSHATGFSGEPMGFVDWKKWLWVMDQSKQGKSDGTNFRQWHITAPAAAPTVAPAAEVTKTIAGFNSSETWTVDPAGDDSFDTAEKQEGTGSLALAIPEDKTYTATRTVSLDLSTYTGPVAASADDKHRIWIFCNKFKKLDEITLELDVNGGDFKTDYYTATLSRKLLKKARKGWFRFEVRKRLMLDAAGNPIDDDKKHPYFTRVGATNAKDWSTVAAIRVKVDARARCQVKLDLWEVFGSINGTIEGEDIQYYYTYVNDQGHESNPSPASPAKAFNRTGASLTSLTASADAQVTGKHIYRTGGTLGAVYRVTSTPVANATTTYTDTSSDDDLTALGIQMETDNDAPPAAQVLVGPYFGKLVAACTAANKNRIFWTKTNKPYAFPGAALDAGNWADAGATNEKIVAMTAHPRMLRIFKENTIWRLIGDPEDTGASDLDITNAKVGAIGANAVCTAGSLDYFQGLEGIYTFDGEIERKISAKLDPIFKNQSVTLSSGVTVPPVSSSNRDKSCLEYVNGRLYYSYPESGSSTPNITLVYDVEGARWYKDSRAFGVIYYEGQNGSLLAGTSGGAVLVLESGTDDAGSAIATNYQSKYYDEGAPDTEKTYEDLTLEFDSGGATLTVVALTNNGDTSTALGTISGSGRTRSVLQFNSGQGVKGRNISVKITGNAGSSPIIIYAATLNYYFEARQAKSFDTDEQDFGTHKMKFIREAMLDLENSATVTLTLQTDHPGEAIATRQAPTISAGTTRRMAHVVFNADYKGFLARLIASATSFRLYGLRVLIQIIGTYLLGGKGEFYQSDALDFGTERVKFIKFVQVVYETAGTAVLTVESDLPGGTSASRATPSLTATTGEETRTLRMTGTLKGRLFKFKIIPTGDFRLEAIRVFIKSVGEPNATPWTWLSLPVESTQDGIWQTVTLPPDEIG